MMNKSLLFPVLALFWLYFPPEMIAQPVRVTYLDDPSWQVADKQIDITHMSAYIAINPFDTLVIGKVIFLFTPMPAQLDSFEFYVPDMSFQSVEVKGVSILYKQRGNKLVIIPSDQMIKGVEYLIVMEYTSHPRYDLFHIGWSEPALRDNKQIWAHRPFHWLPYSDDRLTVDVHITFDENYQVFSNGVRDSVTDNFDSTKTWHYSMYKEHPFFSTALVIGKYDFLQDTTDSGVPLELWYYPWNQDHAEPTYRYTAQMFSFFEDEFGFAYPYELYREAPVEDYLYGAMETTTSTVFGDYLAVDQRAWNGRNYVNVNSHELAHQWFGNCLSHLRGRDVWLTESFATYYAKMFEKHIFGDDYYDGLRDQELNDVLEASRKDGYAVGHSRGGRARWYPKGSLVLDMLRDVLGEDDFKASVNFYLENNAFSEVETSEFLAAIREATGKSMEWFFDEWIYRGGEPKYQVGWHEQKSMQGQRQTVVEVRQVHQRDDLIGLFKMPVNIDVYYDDGSFRRVTPWISDELQEVVIENPWNRNISFVLFDPGRRIIKTVEFEKSLNEWTAQLLGAPLMIDRYDALLALRGFSPGDKKEMLLKAWEKETFQMTRGEVLKQLGPQNVSGWENDADPMVRRAALQALEIIPDGLQEEYEMFLIDQSYINVELALDLLCKSFPGKIPQYLEITKNETGWRGMNIRMKWMEIAIGEMQREYLMELTKYVGPHYEFETRINAFQLLKRLNYLDKTAAKNLIDGYLYWNYKVSNAAKEVLQYFYQQNKYKGLIDGELQEGGLSKADKEKVWHVLQLSL